MVCLWMNLLHNDSWLVRNFTFFATNFGIFFCYYKKKDTEVEWMNYVCIVQQLFFYLNNFVRSGGVLKFCWVVAKVIEPSKLGTSIFFNCFNNLWDNIFTFKDWIIHQQFVSLTMIWNISRIEYLLPYFLAWGFPESFIEQFLMLFAVIKIMRYFA